MCDNFVWKWMSLSFSERDSSSIQCLIVSYTILIKYIVQNNQYIETTLFEEYEEGEEDEKSEEEWRENERDAEEEANEEAEEEKAWPEGEEDEEAAVWDEEEEEKKTLKLNTISYTIPHFLSKWYSFCVTGSQCLTPSWLLLFFWSKWWHRELSE